MLYRECRFGAAYALFKDVEPEIEKCDVFQILGGMTTSVYVYPIRGLKVYIMAGACEKLRFEHFFDQFALQPEKLQISRFLQERPDFERYFYLLPITAEMLNKTTFEGVDTSFMGCSFGLVSGYDKDAGRLVLAHVGSGEEDWLAAGPLLTLNGFSNDLIGPYAVYRIDREQLRSNPVVAASLRRPFRDLVLDNLDTVIRGLDVQEKYRGIRGEAAYDAVIRHFQSLERLMQQQEKPDQAEPIAKYFKIQVSYLRTFVMSGTDHFYRGEFMDTLHKLGRQYPHFHPEAHEAAWRRAALLWRNIGRHLLQLYYKPDPVKLDRLIAELKSARSLEMQEMKSVYTALEGR